jgi:hypothetical protein
MGTKFTYALILTIVGAIFHLLLYFTGFQTEKLAVGQHLNWLGFIIMIVVLSLGIKATREEAPDKSMSYGKGVLTGFLISLISGLMSSVYTFIHFKFVNTEFADYQMAIIRAKWEEVGMGANQMEQAEGFTRAMLSPVAQAIMTPIMAVLFGVIISLVASAFLKRSAPTAPPPVG